MSHSKKPSRRIRKRVLMRPAYHQLKPVTLRLKTVRATRSAATVEKLMTTGTATLQRTALPTTTLKTKVTVPIQTMRSSRLTTCRLKVQATSKTKAATLTQETEATANEQEEDAGCRTRQRTGRQPARHHQGRLRSARHHHHRLGPAGRRSGGRKRDARKPAGLQP